MGVTHDIDAPDQNGHVGTAYARRAAEYAELLGSMGAVHPSDRQLVDTWAAAVSGPAIDAGCGPGHWTDHLHRQGLDVRGIDFVPDFIEHARATYPATQFDAGSIDALPDRTGSVGGILAWYSLIHHDPSAIATPLGEFARVLRPGGDLLLGFFEGPAVETFDHAVVTAYRWPIGELGVRIQHAGFDVIETHTRTGPGHRPHGAILARRADDNLRM